MTTNNPAPVMEEIARPDRLGLQYYSLYDTPSRILRSEGASSHYYRDIYDLYRDMEDKDAHLAALLQTRKNGVLSRPRKIAASGDDAKSRKISDFVSKALDNAGNMDDILSSLLDALGKGLSVMEIMWKPRRGGIVIDQIISRPQGRFLFDTDGNAYLKQLPGTKNLWRTGERSPSSSPSRNLPKRSPVFLNPFLEGRPLPPRKFLIFGFNTSPERPRGNGLLARAYWYYWFKKNNLKFWVMFNEKFGSPTVIGKYHPGAGEEERNRLFEVVESLQNDTGVTIPDNVALEFLEAKRSGNINTYRDLADWCNDEMSKLILGATLSTGEGRRSGSLALGKIHEQVRSEYIEADARAVMNLLNRTLIRWLVDFNFGMDVPAPRLVIDTAENDELDREIRLDRELVSMGVPLPLSYFYRRYRKPAPVGEERSLRYDDNNLYQYHVQFGVLTINEIRHTLGLEPVPWGDVPPATVGDQTGTGEEQSAEERGKQIDRERKAEN